MRSRSESDDLCSAGFWNFHAGKPLDVLHERGAITLRGTLGQDVFIELPHRAANPHGNAELSCLFEAQLDVLCRYRGD